MGGRVLGQGSQRVRKRASSWRLRHALGLIGLAWAVVVCESTGSSNERAALHIRWTDSVRLEEPSGVLNVAPVVSADPLGGALVADVREFQVRRYDDRGKLLLRFGKRGGGPGEFSAPPLATLRLTGGNILVADANGVVHIFDSTGRYVSRHRVASGPIFGLNQIGSRVLIAAQRHSARETTFLHFWNPGSDSVQASFFTAPVVVHATPMLITSSAWAAAAVLHDTIYATFSLTDTMYLFSSSGTPLTKQPLRLRFFKYHSSDPPATARSPFELRSWMGDASRIERPYAAPNGALFVQYSRRGDAGPVWMIGLRDRHFEPQLDDTVGAQLLFVRHDGRAVFLDPLAQAPNSWKVASVGSGVAR